MARSSVREAVAVLAVTAVGATLRIRGLGEESLWNDEFASMEDALALGPNLLLDQLRVARPLYYLLLRPWIEIFGTSPAAMRSLSVLLGVATIPAVYLLARELYGHRTGLLAGILLTFSRFHVRWSQDVRMYALLGLLATVFALAFLRYRRVGGRRLRVGYVVAASLLLYTHLYGAFVVLALVSYAAARDALERIQMREASSREWWATQSIVGVLALPAAAAVAATSVQVFAGDRGAVEWLGKPHILDLLWMPTQHIYRTDNLIAAVALGAVLLALGLYQTLTYRQNPDHALLLTWVTAVVAAPFLVSVAIKPMLTLRYTIAGLPATTIFASRGLDRVMKRIDAVFIRRMFVLGLIIVMIPPLVAYYEEPQRAQWKDAVAHVEGHAGTDDVVLVTPAYTARNYEYYADREGLQVVGLSPSAPRGDIETHLQGADTAWVVASQNMNLTEMRRLHATLNGTTIETADVGADRYRVVASPEPTSFHNVEVVRYNVERDADER